VAILGEPADLRTGDLVFLGDTRDTEPTAGRHHAPTVHPLGRVGATVHGWRSTLRNADGGEAGQRVEAALAHVTGRRVQAAYQRLDLLDHWCRCAA